MVPLYLAAAVTIHKAQGATLQRVRINVGEYERQLGLLFVANSRVRRLEDLSLERPINGDRLDKIASSRNLPLRKQLDAHLETLEFELDALLRARLAVPRPCIP